MHTRPQNIYTVAEALKSYNPTLSHQQRNENGIFKSNGTVSEEVLDGGAIAWLLGTFAATGVFAAFVFASRYFLEAKTIDVYDEDVTDDAVDKSDLCSKNVNG